MKYIASTLFAATFIIMNIPGILRASNPLPIGSEAPTPPILDQDGKPFDLAAAYAGGTVLLYFYPKASTPGCTAQACSLRDDIENLKDLGVTVIGASRDTPQAQKKFAESQNLPFTLLADDDGELATAFGVGSLLGMASRSSFIIKGGKIVWVAPRAKTSGHASEVQAALAALEKSDT
jgi:peroxiredoxin Q/BCP